MTSTPTYSQAMPSEPFQARDVAAAIRRRLPAVGARKLHKLLYYAQGHHLAAFGQQLFVQSISAWDMGPVVGPFGTRSRRQTTRLMRPLSMRRGSTRSATS